MKMPLFRSISNLPPEREKPTTKSILVEFAALALAAALPTGALADTANTVTVTKFHQSNPYSGKATVEYTVGGTLPANAFAEITINTDDASATFVQSNIVTGANSHVIDFASSFDGAVLVAQIRLIDTKQGKIPQLWTLYKKVAQVSHSGHPTLRSAP